MGFRKLIIDEEIWIWKKETQKLGNFSKKNNSSSKNITKKKLTKRKQGWNKWKDLAKKRHTRVTRQKEMTPKTRESVKRKEEVIKKWKTLNQENLKNEKSNGITQDDWHKIENWKRKIRKMS
jgi:hypothetical protein